MPIYGVMFQFFFLAMIPIFVFLMIRMSKGRHRRLGYALGVLNIAICVGIFFEMGYILHH